MARKLGYEIEFRRDEDFPWSPYRTHERYLTREQVDAKLAILRRQNWGDWRAVKTK